MSWASRANKSAHGDHSIDWENEDNLAKLRQLWSDGLSTAEIARRMNTSKNSIVGKAHRINLPRRDSPIRHREDGYVPEPQMPKRVRAGASTLPALSVVADPLPVVHERPRQQPCSWPIGEPGKPSFHFCNGAAVQGKPYCEDHAAIAYVRVRDRREDST